jgi:hypothetical protein
MASLDGVEIDDIGEDLYLPIYRTKLLRISNRLLKPFQRRELHRSIIQRMTVFKPDVLVVYKGTGVGKQLVEFAKELGLLTVNIFPDCSPHAHGASLKDAMGIYDLVISTKSYHPDGWKNIYGYDNSCVCVPHGYDPDVHLWNQPPKEQTLDIVMAATWRPQYEKLMLELHKKIADKQLKVGIAGAGWKERHHRFPPDWDLAGPLTGRSYGSWLRRGKIAIAPVHTDMWVNGAWQPGDQDTTRTYELAASWCFFLHRRTPFVQTLYDESGEVPMWDTADELASLVIYYLSKVEERKEIAARARARAVPHYSIPARSEEVLKHIMNALGKKCHD